MGCSRVIPGRQAPVEHGAKTLWLREALYQYLMLEREKLKSTLSRAEMKGKWHLTNRRSHDVSQRNVY
jgi:hypothetical protein